MDFDRDGDLDLVKVGPSKPLVELVDITEVLLYREVRYYENVTWNRF